LSAGQLAALAGFRALRHLDLEVVGVDEVFAGHAEAAGRHLLDRTARASRRWRPAEARRILAAFAGVGLAADAVHRDGQRLVRLGADRAVGHRAGVRSASRSSIDSTSASGTARGAGLNEQAAQRRAMRVWSLTNCAACIRS
jgi:hypothetical protein